jgi:hypothetical protein
MKRSILVLFAALVLLAPLSAQSLDTVASIGEKPACAVADLAAMAPSILRAFPERTDLAVRIRAAFAKYAKDKPLTKARASYIIAKSLRVKSSFMFVMFPGERNAFRALVGDGVFGSASSGGEVMSGTDLLDFVSAIDRAYRVKK